MCHSIAFALVKGPLAKGPFEDNDSEPGFGPGLGSPVPQSGIDLKALSKLTFFGLNKVV